MSCACTKESFFHLIFTWVSWYFTQRQGFLELIDSKSRLLAFERAYNKTDLLRVSHAAFKEPQSDNQCLTVQTDSLFDVINSLYSSLKTKAVFLEERA